MIKLFFSLLLSLVAVGCGPRYVDYFPYNDDGTVKPAVALLPVIDSTGVNLPWSVSEALKGGIEYEIMNDGELYLLSREEIKDSLGKLTDYNFMIRNEALAEQFYNADFVVVPELMEYKLVPYEVGSSPGCLAAPSTLMIRLRLRIVDVRRTRCPRVILQEMITRSYMLPHGDENLFGQEGAMPPYGYSTIGKVHKCFASYLVNRIEEVVRSVH